MTYKKILQHYCNSKYYLENFDQELLKCMEEDLKQIAPGNYRLIVTRTTDISISEIWNYVRPVFDDADEEVWWLLKWA